MFPDSTFLRRVFFAAALGAAMLALAPEAATQTLVSRVGDPIPYRVDLPALAQVSGDGAFIQADSDDFMVLVGAVDMMRDENQHPASQAKVRRIVTNAYVGSDSLMLELLDAAARAHGLEFTSVRRESRTLGGQRSAYLRGETTCNHGHESVIEMHVTVKDGIAYLLMFGSHAENVEGREPLMARIHDSFILADAPPPASAQASTVERIERSR